MFLVKRIVGLRVLYIYSFAFDLVELGECTRIRGLVSTSTILNETRGKKICGGFRCLDAHAEQERFEFSGTPETIRVS